jgi:hypothetical protein
MGDVPDPQIHQVAAAQLAINGQVKHGQVAHRMPVLQVNPDRPDLLGLERGLLPDKFALVPRFAFLDGFQFRLLGC